MHQRPEENAPDNPLRHLTAAQFMALGGNAVIYVRAISGHELNAFIPDQDFDGDEQFQLVVSADGSPLFVGDTQAAVAEWLADKDLGIVALH